MFFTDGSAHPKDGLGAAATTTDGKRFHVAYLGPPGRALRKSLSCQISTGATEETLQILELLNQIPPSIKIYWCPGHTGIEMAETRRLRRGEIQSMKTDLFVSAQQWTFNGKRRDGRALYFILSAL